MTIKQALKEIQSRPKWYQIVNKNGVINSTTMANTARNIKNGKCKHETMRKFFEHYGYTYTVKEDVVKNEVSSG